MCPKATRNFDGVVDAEGPIVAEFFGDRRAIATQKLLLSMQDEFASNPALANGGRILNIIDIAAVGWTQIARYVADHGFVALTMVPKDPTLAQITAQFGSGVDTPCWEAFTGDANTVTSACNDLLSNGTLPDGWHAQSLTHLTDEVLQQVQDLNTATGVAPTPGYYLRGEMFPSMTTCLWDGAGQLAGCANATMRYHPSSRLAGYLFAGAVSINPDHRRMGLGTLVNAMLLRDSQAKFGWTWAIEQARLDNAASCGMIVKCGLSVEPGIVTIAVNTSGGYLTR